MTQPATAPTPPPYPKPDGTGSPAPAKTPPPPSQADASSVKETLESILVAFILAFIFRAFVVEAFVIPTGSMAPTLLGAHMRFRCPDCGYRFDVNYSPQQSGDDLIIRSSAAEAYRVFCPNCGYKLPQTDAANPQNGTNQPPVHYGDRILVLKYLYLLRDPQRWDVVVFKSPDREPNLAPPTYTQNYIKRLIGTPGEQIMILDGDIYVGKPGQDIADFTVQSKPRYAQEALWRVIYDNDYPPTGLVRPDGSKWRQPWTPRDGSGWDLSSGVGGRVFKFNNSSGGSTLSFDRDAVPVFDRQINPHPYAFTDLLSYDSEVDPLPSTQYPLVNYSQLNIVHDLKLSFVYERSAGDGPLRAKLTNGKDAFVAEITPTEAKLFHDTPAGNRRQVGATFSMPRSRGPVRVELTNADYQVTLRIEDQVAAVTSTQEYHPDTKALLDDYNAQRPGPVPTVEIQAENQTSSLSHVGLWRDVYYINRPARGAGVTFSGTPSNVMRLGEDEYFVLGDNSLISGDARYWNVPIHLPADRLDVEAGRVPGRFLLGRAFFVYWPAGFRPGPGLPGIAPDFGDMRFIR